jgi:hypothetical protein
MQSAYQLMIVRHPQYVVEWLSTEWNEAFVNSSLGAFLLHTITINLAIRELLTIAKIEKVEQSQMYLLEKKLAEFHSIWSSNYCLQLWIGSKSSYYSLPFLQ